MSVYFEKIIFSNSFGQMSKTFFSLNIVGTYLNVTYSFTFTIKNTLKNTTDERQVTLE